MLICFQYQNKNLSLYSPYYAEACNEFVVSTSVSYWPRQHSYLRRCWSGGEPFATLCKIWPVRDLNSRPPAYKVRAITVSSLRWLFSIVYRIYQYQSHNRVLYLKVFTSNSGKSMGLIWINNTSFKEVWKYNLYSVIVKKQIAIFMSKKLTS